MKTLPPRHAQNLHPGQCKTCILLLLRRLFELKTLSSFRGFSKQVGLVTQHINDISVRRHRNSADPVAFAVGIVKGTLNLLGCGSFLGVGNLLQWKYEPYLSAFLSRYQTPITLKDMESLSACSVKRIQVATKRRRRIGCLDIASRRGFWWRRELAQIEPAPRAESVLFQGEYEELLWCNSESSGSSASMHEQIAQLPIWLNGNSILVANIALGVERI